MKTARCYRNLTPHQRTRFRHAESVCAALRRYVGSSVSDPRNIEAFHLAVNRLIKWMRIAPQRIKFEDVLNEKQRTEES